MADQRDPETIVYMTKDGKNFAETTLHSLTEVWSWQGWKEAKASDVETQASATAYEAAGLPTPTKSTTKS